MWQDGAIVAETDDGVTRALVANVSAPEYNKLAAAESPDGTITLLYASGTTAVAQRVTPDGTVGAPVAVANVEDLRAFSPQLVVDAHGTAFGRLPRAVVRWPHDGPPRLLDAPRGSGALVGDGHDGVWQRLDDDSLVHVGDAGVREIAVRADTDPAVDAQGNAVVAWSASGRTHVVRATPNGALDTVSVLRSEDVESVALDPRTGDAWVSAHVGHVLVAQGPGRTLVLRGRRGAVEARSSLAIDASGRAWALWSEERRRPARGCDVLRLRGHVRWATFGLHARRVTNQMLIPEGDL